MCRCGAWLEFETSAKDLLTVKVDRKRKLPVTTLLRALAPEYGTDEALVALFADADTDAERRFIEATIGLGGATSPRRTTRTGGAASSAARTAGGARRDPARSHAEGLLEVYRRLRPGDPATADNARNLVQSLFFNPRRYDLGRVGRYKPNKRLGEGMAVGRTERTLTPDDLVAIVRTLVLLNRDQGRPDDVDHLGNRRIRAAGELIQHHLRIRAAGELFRCACFSRRSRCRRCRGLAMAVPSSRLPVGEVGCPGRPGVLPQPQPVVEHHPGAAERPRQGPALLGCGLQAVAVAQQHPLHDTMWTAESEDDGRRGRHIVFALSVHAVFLAKVRWGVLQEEHHAALRVVLAWPGRLA